MQELEMLLSALRKLFARSASAAPDFIAVREAKAMLPLVEAAAMIREAARKEGMVIFTVAEPAGAAQWFAASIASVVPVYRRDADAGFVKLATPIGSDAADLYIRRRDYPVYLRWARSMQ